MPRLRSLVAWGALLLLAAGVPLSGCKKPGPTPDPNQEPSGPAWFEEIGTACGIDFVHDAGETPGDYALPQITGSGVALFDFDGDGLLDLYLIHNGGPGGAKNRLYRQRPDHTFQDVSAGSGLDVAGYGMGAAVGDVNNDGRPDLLLTQYGRVRLFLNNGDGTFADATKQAGLEETGWSTSACFFDLDRDGWLDLVIAKYADYDPSLHCRMSDGSRDYCSPTNYKGSAAKLYRNLGGQAGGGVRFKDVSLESGVGLVPGRGLGVLCADFDGDGWPDIFVANDLQPNRLWINQKDGTFKEEAVARGVAYNAMGVAEANMGVGWGDVDGDGLEDLFVTHLYSETNTLWRQGPRGLFRDATAASGLGRPLWRATGFGTALADFDHDGLPDVVIANGRVAKRPPGDATTGLGPFWSQYADRNQVFANAGGGRFKDVSAANPALCGGPNVGRGLAVGDLDNSGALGLVVTAVAGPARLYRNVALGRGHWLVVRALDPGLKRDAHGAVVEVDAGGKRWRRTVAAGGSYLSQSDARAHFGLGGADRVEAIRVRWPDGTGEDFPGGPADRHLVLRKGDGRPAP